MRLARFLDALRLLGGIHLGLGRANGLGGALRRGFGRRQCAPRGDDLGRTLADGGARRVDLGLPAIALGVGFGDADLHLVLLAADGLELLAHAAAVLAEEGKLLLERLDVGVGRVERALQFLEVVGALVVLRAQLLQRALVFAKSRGLGFQRHRDLLHLVACSGSSPARPREGA